MGDDRRKSVVDPNQFYEDHDDVCRIGSGAFPPSTTADPAFPIAALVRGPAEFILNNKLKA
jgi:hypothetical protein